MSTVIENAIRPCLRTAVGASPSVAFQVAEGLPAAAPRPPKSVLLPEIARWLACVGPLSGQWTAEMPWPRP